MSSLISRKAQLMPDSVRPQLLRSTSGGGYPFAERMQLWRDALAKGLETWVDIVAANAGGLSATTRGRLLANDPAAMVAMAEYDRRCSPSSGMSTQPV
jgi:hypothetical protein